jgi:hypothetical protein
MQYRIPIMLIAVAINVPRLARLAAPVPVDVAWETSAPVRATAAGRMGGDKCGFAPEARPNGGRAELPNAEAD